MPLSAVIRSIVICIAAGIVTYSPAQEDPASLARLEAHAQDSDYVSWMQPFRASPLVADSLGIHDESHTNLAFMKLTVVEGDDLPLDKRMAERFGRSYRISYYGCSVSMVGRVSFFRHDFGGFKGGGYRFSGGNEAGSASYQQLSPSDFAELKRLASNLPDDYSHLPPPGRRLVIQVATPPIARVYDRANMPDSVLDILPLIDPGVQPWILHLKPEPMMATDGNPIPIPQIPMRPVVSPDGSLAALQGNFKIRILDGHTSSSLRELEEPDAGRQIGALSSPYFTPDGRYLILHSNFSGIRIFDTKSWQQVPSLPEVPPGAVAFFPSPDWLSAIVLSDTGQIQLWAPGANAAVATLARDEEIVAVTFSPDRSLVAVATRLMSKKDGGGIHVRIWSANDGSLKSELHPPDVQPTATSMFGGDSFMLAWWPDDKYLLTSVRSNGFSNLAFWNVSSGRYRAVLDACPGMVNRFALDAESEQIVVECDSGNSLLFNATAAMKAVRDFEQSLEIDK